MNQNTIPLIRTNIHYKMDMSSRIAPKPLTQEEKDRISPQFARHIVKKFIDIGIIKRKNKCETCRKGGKIIAHHPNYLRPLWIMWLCESCHGYWHVDYAKRNKMSVSDYFYLHIHEAPSKHSYLNHYNRRRNLILDKFS